MQPDQMNAKVLATPTPLSAQRSRMGARSAVRIGSRCTIPPLTQNVNRADMARQEEAGTILLPESSFVDEVVTPSDTTQKLVNSTAGEEDAWLNDSMPPLSELKPAIRPEAQPEQTEIQAETALHNHQVSLTREPEPEP